MTIWCWVADQTTGHRYDIPITALDRLEASGAVREIPGRRRMATAARRAKHFVDLSGRRAVPARRPAEIKE